MPLWKDGSLFDSSLKNASNDETQPSSDAGKKDDEGVCKESGIADQEKSEATHVDFFSDETEVDMSNITSTFISGVLTRRMTKTTNEQGFISAVYEGKSHEDLYTCLFACFLSQEEPKKVIQALKDPSWIEAMQKELLQFKLQQGYTQEERIDCDEVFAIVARIEAIRLFLAYASFKDFIVYHMDVKNAFLYGKIEEEVYVCQPPGFEDLEFSDRVYKKDNGIFINQDKYADEILKKFVFSTVKTANTPMETSKPLMKDENAEDVDVHLYRSMIGSLMYLTSSRPDIMFADSPFDLEAYTESDYAGASLDQKSATGEYVAAASCCRQVLWIQNQMLDYG
ncbi:ribonuclease H-like domain-containing protein [Tanacetum coccineum]